MTEQQFILAHDLGTTGDKATLFDAVAAQPVASASELYGTSYPQPNWAEQNPQDWQRAFIRCTQRLLERSSIPSHIHLRSGFIEFIDEFKRHPEKHNILEPGLMFDPKVVFFLDYHSDEQGWAHSMQVHPDGSADYIHHRPEELDKGIRWISRTADQDVLGIVLPATAEPEGYLAEKAKGNLKAIPAGGTFRCEL